MPQQGERVRVDQKVRKVNRLQLGGQSLDIKRVYLGAVNLESLDDADQYLITFTISNNKGLQLFIIPEISIYEGTSMDSTKTISGGSAIGVNDYVIDRWYDYDRSDGNNIAYAIAITNNSGSATQFHARIGARQLVEQI